jgi:uncharacterized repeat protein (TIGR01451 family)
MPVNKTGAQKRGNAPETRIHGPAGEGGGPSSDLGVMKTATDTVAPDSDITYEITVTNSSTDPADNATLNDVLPATLTFVSIAAPMNWNCMTPSVGSEGSVICTTESLPFTEGDIFTIVVHVPADTPPGTFFNNTATISTTSFDPNDENNSSSASTLVQGTSADIAVTKSTDSIEVPAGRPITYMIQVTNTGPDAAENATLIDNLPGTVKFGSLSVPDGWICMTPAPGQSGTVSCTRESLPITTGDVFTLMVSIREDTPPDTVIVNMATVDTSTAEPNEENNSDSASTITLEASPTAADGRINGKILDGQGRPLAGVTITLNGTQSRRTITDAGGAYQFDRVETNGFYTLTPARANYDFSPANRSFSLLGNRAEETFSGLFTGDVANPLDVAEYFVRQQYVDVLGREPDESGFNYWSDQILACGNDAACTRARRVDVAAAFFVENEFKQSGAFIYNVYESGFGRRPAYNEYSADRTQVVGGSTLDAQKQAFVDAFVRRAEFVSRYENNLSAASFVDALLANVQAAGIDLSSRRESLVGLYNTGTSLTESRGIVLRELSEDADVRSAHYNAAFVETEYFGYLHRNPDAQGRAFWLNVLNGRDGGNYRAMVCSFITSAEYQRRFSTVVSHSNAECGNQ